MQVPALTLLPLQEAGELERGSVTVTRAAVRFPALPEKTGKTGIKFHADCLPSVCEDRQTHTHTTHTHNTHTHTHRDTYTNTQRHTRTHTQTQFSYNLMTFTHQDTT